MGLTIELPGELEERLRRSAAEEGMDVRDYTRHLIEQGLAADRETPGSLWHSLGATEWCRRFQEWAVSHAHSTAPVIPLEALRREHLYEDRL